MTKSTPTTKEKNSGVGWFEFDDGFDKGLCEGYVGCGWFFFFFFFFKKD